jgi:putative membrane protein insertion efficiency factor
MTKICKPLICVIFAILFFVSNPFLGFSKTSPKIAKVEKLYKPENHSHNYKSYLKKSNNELESSAAILFIVYKNFFSSQDMNSCVFSPSCSVYAIESFEHNNPFEAYLKIFDRLSRCSPLVAKGEYPYNFQIQKYDDPAY